MKIYYTSVQQLLLVVLSAILLFLKDNQLIQLFYSHCFRCGPLSFTASQGFLSRGPVSRNSRLFYTYSLFLFFYTSQLISLRMKAKESHPKSGDYIPGRQDVFTANVTVVSLSYLWITLQTWNVSSNNLKDTNLGHLVIFSTRFTSWWLSFKDVKSKEPHS